MARQLKIVQIGGTNWFVDERLGELRNVNNPSEVLTMDEARMLIHIEKNMSHCGG